MINIKLSEDAICMAVRYSKKDLKKISCSFGKNGILFMQYINIYLCNYGGRVGLISDLRNIVPKELSDEFMGFIGWMKKSHNMGYLSGKYFYLPLRNKILGYSEIPTNYDIAYMNLLRGKNLYICPFALADIRKFMYNVVDEINASLPVYAADAERLMMSRHNNKNLDICLRLTSYYLRHSTCMIGVISDKDIAAQIINLKGLYLLYFLKDNPNIYIDYENKIFCDCKQRLLHGFTEKPLDTEIKMVKNNFRMRVNFMKTDF